MCLTIRPSEKGMYHIHIDAKTLPPSLELIAKDMGFYDADQQASPDGYHLPSNRHLTYKTADRQATDDRWAALDLFTSFHRADDNKFIGYFEREMLIYYAVLGIENELIEDYIAAGYDDVSGRNPWNGEPFPIRMQRVSLEQIGRRFRESEFHVSMDSRSDPGLLKTLVKAGFNRVDRDMGDYVRAIFTAQGLNEDMKRLKEPLVSYLTRAGGSINCRVFWELILAGPSDNKNSPKGTGYALHGDVDLMPLVRIR